MRPLLKLVVPLLLLLPATPSLAQKTQMQGFYEFFAQASRADETFQLNGPKHYFELKFLSNPWKDVEGFVRFGASTDRRRTFDFGLNPTTRVDVDQVDGVFDPEFFFGEGHIKFRGNNFETVLFSGQDRFWFSQPLLEIVNGGQLKEDLGGPRSQGLRVDLWDVKGFSGQAFWGHKPNSNEDFVAGRFFRNLANRRILLGTTFAHKNFGSTSSDYDFTVSFDAEVALGELITPLERLGRLTYVVAAGRNLSGYLPEDADDVDGIQMELRDLKLGPFLFKTQYFYREPEFYVGGLTFRSGDNDDRGAQFDVFYSLPGKQIDLNYSYWFNNPLRDLGSDGNIVEEWRHEVQLFAELRGGFRAWTKFKHYEGNRATGISRDFQDLIFQLQGQNQLLSIRPQIRFKDINTAIAVNAYGVEFNLNVSSRWKFYSRLLNVQEDSESRRTYFAQVRYDAWQNAEMFFEFGDPFRSDRLTEKDEFVNVDPSAVDELGERRVQAFLKIYF